MIRVNIHSGVDGGGNGRAIDEIRAARTDSAGLLWVDVESPTDAEMARIGQEFGLHPLVIEDAVRRHERPKIDLFDDYISIVFYELDMVDERPMPRELSIITGRDFVITVRDDDLAALAEVAERWQAGAQVVGVHDPGMLLYALLDAIVDGYFPVVDAIAERIEDLEQAIFAGRARETQGAIFGLKKDLLAVRRIIAPERDVMNVLVRRDAPLVGDQELTYFQDVYDHLLRVTDSVDLYRDLLSSALDANLTMISYRLDETIKRMTSASIILMSTALIAGIYGMNFDNMPELHWRYGYAYALAAMLVVGGALAAFFRRIDWL